MANDDSSHDSLGGLQTDGTNGSDRPIKHCTKSRIVGSSRPLIQSNDLPLIHLQITFPPKHPKWGYISSKPSLA